MNCCGGAAVSTGWPDRRRGDLAQVGRHRPGKAAQVLAALELGRRTLAHAPGARVQLRSPRDAAALPAAEFGARPVEQFGIVLLDTKHRVLRTTIVASAR